MFENINPPSKEIHIAAADVQRIVTKLLSHIDNKKRYIVPISNICIVDGVASEIQLSVLRSMINCDLVSINNSDLSIILTKKGKEKLNVLMKI
ncbi:MAG: hypothetical protein FP824_07835 [Euryarchaeota archaeon]|nr:hypothetical protein [Euryarchaeota archaeon]